MHGAANDFIMVDDRDLSFPIQDREWLARISTRRTGVGCEGIILIQPSTSADFRMRFINPDGGEVEMCGNGARCVARLAHDWGVAPRHMTIETIAGPLRAEIIGDLVRLRMTDPKDARWNAMLALPGQSRPYGFVNTGVPHVVMMSDDLQKEPVRELGRTVRNHPDFQPRGTNANFVQAGPGNVLRVRTYERGVEDETLACGTGMVACALVMAKAGKVTLPVTVIPASGDRLEVNAIVQNDGFRDVTLTGPAVRVFQGTLTYPG